MQNLGWLVLALSAACGTEAPADVGPDAAVAPPVDAATIVETGTVTDIWGAPLGGAQVCVLNHTEVPCGVTDGTGRYALTVPLAITKLSVGASRPGYLGEVRLQQETNNGFNVWPSGFALYPAADAQARFGTQAGFAMPGTGIVEIRADGVNGGVLSGVTATLAPTSPARAVYLDAEGTPDPSLTATTTANEMLFGDLAPGTYTLTATASGNPCSVEADIAGDWTPAGAGTTDFVIAADSLTNDIIINCE